MPASPVSWPDAQVERCRGRSDPRHGRSTVSTTGVRPAPSTARQPGACRGAGCLRCWIPPDGKSIHYKRYDQHLGTLSGCVPPWMLRQTAPGLGVDEAWWECSRLFIQTPSPLLGRPLIIAAEIGALSTGPAQTHGPIRRGADPASPPGAAAPCTRHAAGLFCPGLDNRPEYPGVQSARADSSVQSTPLC